MAVTVSDDFTVIDAFDNATDQDSDGGNIGNTGSTNTTIKVEGTASNMYQAKGIGIGFGGKWNSAWNKNISSTHLVCSLRSVDYFNLDASNGYRIRVGTDAGAASNYGTWYVGGRDTRRAALEGFIFFAVDTTRTFDDQSGTPPALTSVDGIWVGGDQVSSSGQNTFFVDEMKEGSKITVTGGGVSTQGTSTEIAADDATNGRGLFKDIGGVFYVLCGVDFGDTATANSYFKDVGQTWLFEDQPVASDYYKVVFDGGTGTNDVQFGNLVGSGITATGVGGDTWIANGAPFSVEALNSDIAVKFYGQNWLNAGDVDGTIRLEQANASAISCLASNCGNVVVRNGALLRKGTITDSAASATQGALDLGGADPTADSVRDLQIQNSTNGILLSGTGDVTYNFRNIKFAGNTNDVRVAFGATDTVTINVLEGGDTPTISKADAGTTVIVNNTVTVSVKVIDTNTKANIHGARVLLRADTGGDLPAGEAVTITRSGSTATVTHTGHGAPDGSLIVIDGADQSEYNGIQTITVTGVNSYTYTVSGTPATPATGTIAATSAILSGLTNASGEITDTGFNFTTNQPVEGEVVKGIQAPVYKDGSITGTISSGGFSTTVPMIPD